MNVTTHESFNTEQKLIKKNLVIIDDLIDQMTNYLSAINSSDTTLKFNDNNDDLKKVNQSIIDLKLIITQYIGQQNYNNTTESWRIIRHELRTKVGSIIGYAELILDEIDSKYSEIIINLKHIVDMGPAMLSAIESIASEAKLVPQAEDDTIQDDSSCYVVDAPHQSTILIVDDSSDKRGLIKRRLLANHHNILEAQSAEDALRLMETATVDLILLDLILPEISGYNLLMHLKSQSLTADIPILITSSLNDMQHIVQCIRAGAEDYLPTPIDKTLLLARVNASIAKKKLLDQSKRYQLEILQVQECLEAALQSVNDGFVIYDQNDRIYMCNQPFQQLYPVSMKSYPADKLTYQQFLKANFDANLYCHLHGYDFEQHDLKQKSFVDWSAEFIKNHKNPREPYLQQFRNGRWIEITEKLIPQGGVVAIHSDVTQRIIREQEYQHMASHDQLTGLYNRHFFEKIILKTISANHGEKFAILFFDLDGFKAVNDHFGHQHGDFLLKSVANKLLQILRISDSLARIGGDEFCALISQFNTIDELSKLATRCADAVGNRIEYQGEQLNFGISIGIAQYPKHGDTPELLLSHADAAMYVAKKSGKNQYYIAQ